jgi:uroporphyrinogen-III synthase
MDPVAMPLFEIEPLPWEAPDLAKFDGLLLTSANAVRSAGARLEELRGLSVYAVGEATAAAARDAGFDISATGSDGIDRLLGSIEPDLRLLHLCGEDRRGSADARQRITCVPVYRARTIDHPSLTATQGAVVLVHSPRAAIRFGELVKDRGSIAVVAISRAAAEPLGSGWERVEVASEPTDDALLALAARLCNKPAPQ